MTHHLQLPMQINATVIEEVAAALVEDDIPVPSYPSLQGSAVSPMAEVISLEQISVSDCTIGAPPLPRSQSHVTIQSLIKTKNAELLDHEAEQLMDMGFPRGLALEMGTTRSLFPIRFWILDNSGSMLTNDGATLRGKNRVTCTRWAELEETVNFHAEFAATIEATSVFRLLNDPGHRCESVEFSVGEGGGKFAQDEVQAAKRIMRSCQPTGPTPLTAHIYKIADHVSAMADEMRARGLKAVLILATDGLPTSREGISSREFSQEFIRALQQLQTLPIWLVVRLFTDEEEVVDFYNGLDMQLEMNMEVIDDFFNEAKEIYKCNRWLNYARPIHTCREIGYQNRIFDLLDERPLNQDEVYEFCVMLFGRAFAKTCSSNDKWSKVLDDIERFLGREQKHLNPVSKKMEPLINMKNLRTQFATGIISKLKRASWRSV